MQSIHYARNPQNHDGLFTGGRTGDRHPAHRCLREYHDIPGYTKGGIPAAGNYLQLPDDPGGIAAGHAFSTPEYQHLPLPVTG